MRHAAWVIPPLVLAAVLGLSAWAKWGQGESLHAIIRNLKLPARLLPAWLAPSMPGLEVALAVGLLTPWRPVFLASAAGSALLMTVYWGLIVRGLTLSPRPRCGCFGRVGDHRISFRTLVRNTLLVGAAASSVGLAASGGTAWSGLSAGTTSDWLWLVLSVLACVVTGLVLAGPGTAVARAGRSAAARGRSRTAPATEPEEDDYVRVPIPATLLHDPDTGPATLLELTRSRAQLLVFVNCHCASTREVTRAIPVWQDGLGMVDVRLVFSVPLPRGGHDDPLPSGSLVDHAGLTWKALGLVEPSPSAVLLGTDGLVAGGPVSGMDELREFVDDIEEALRDARVAAVETSVPTPVEEPRITSDR